MKSVQNLSRLSWMFKDVFNGLVSFLQRFEYHIPFRRKKTQKLIKIKFFQPQGGINDKRCSKNRVYTLPPALTVRLEKSFFWAIVLRFSLRKQMRFPNLLRGETTPVSASLNIHDIRDKVWTHLKKSSFWTFFDILRPPSLEAEKVDFLPVLCVFFYEKKCGTQTFLETKQDC